MKRILFLSALLLVLSVQFAWGQILEGSLSKFNGSSVPPTGVTTISLPTNLGGTSGSTVEVPIAVSTTATIAIAQFVVEYNSSVLTFTAAGIGTDAVGFQITNVNQDTNTYYC